jgi:hypothetical protein
LIDAGAVAGKVDMTNATDFYGQARMIDADFDGLPKMDIGPVEYKIVTE